MPITTLWLLLNDLGNNRPLKKGPSLAGHDMPLCLMASSLSVATRTLVTVYEEREQTSMRQSCDLVDERHRQVAFEVAQVPERLLSRFRGFDVTVELLTKDGERTWGILHRRESSPDQMLRELISRHGRQARELEQDELPEDTLSKKSEDSHKDA